MDKSEIKGGYNPNTAAKLLGTILFKADSTGEYGFIENAIDEYFGIEKADIFMIEDYLKYFEQLGLITFDGMGEDGFYIQYYGEIKIAAKQYFLKEIYDEQNQYKNELLNKIEILEQEKASIMEYNQEHIRKEIITAKSQIDNILQQMKGNQIFDSIRPLVMDLSKYIESVESINNTYESIFKNIIKPIKKESEAGVKATAFWAILSIVASTVISILITNWASISKIMNW